MYIPLRHEPPTRAAMIQVIRSSPLATVIRYVKGELIADHIPLVLANDDAILQGHVATDNPLSQEKVAEPVLVIFNGPEHYISPSWCTSKLKNPAIVPTWNYVAVHAKGWLRHNYDKDWLLSHLHALTSQSEASVGECWQITDAPQEYLEHLLTGIVGIEIEVVRLWGKWKTTVVKPEENIDSVAGKLREIANGDSARMAELVKKRKTKKC